MTKGFKTSEFCVLVAGMLVAVLPVIVDKVPADSLWAPLLGSLLAAATYIAGRSWVKTAEAKADAIKTTAAAVPQANPQAN